MDFDINEVLTDMLGAIKSSVGENWPQVKDTASEFMSDRKQRLETIAQFVLDKQLTLEQAEVYLNAEKRLLESELHSIAIISKAVAQHAANAALDVLYKAIRLAIGI